MTLGQIFNGTEQLLWTKSHINSFNLSTFAADKLG